MVAYFTCSLLPTYKPNGPFIWFIGSWQKLTGTFTEYNHFVSLLPSNIIKEEIASDSLIFGAVKAKLLLYSTHVLYHSASVFRVCWSLSHLYHQSILLYLQTWPLWPEVLTCQWEDRCPRAILCHSCHSCTLDWDLRTSWSFRMRTFYYQARLHPSTAFHKNHVTPTGSLNL